MVRLSSTKNLFKGGDGYRKLWLTRPLPYGANAPINVVPAGEGVGRGRAWGGDLIVFVGPRLGHLTDFVLPGEGIFESFFARRGDI